MAVTLVKGTNTYATLAEAETYHESHVDASGTWADATDAAKNIALAMATRLLDSKYIWNGTASEEDQSLLWPRTGVWDFLRLSIIDEDEIPQRLTEATAELARVLLASDTTGDLAQSVQGLVGLQVGSVNLSFKDSGIVSSKPVPDSVRDLIPSWWGKLKGSGGTGSYGIVRA